MNRETVIGKLAFVFSALVKILFMLSLLLIMGCVDDGKYNVFLVVDTKDYQSAMQWDEVREQSFKKSYNVKVSDSEGYPVRLYRFNHDDGSIMPESGVEIHISTPIIIEKKYDTVSLLVLDQGTEVMRVPVVIKNLKRITGGPKAFVLPVDLPLKPIK